MEKRKLIDSDLAPSPRDEKEAVGQFTRGQTLSATKLGHPVGAGLVPALPIPRSRAPTIRAPTIRAPTRGAPTEFIRIRQPHVGKRGYTNKYEDGLKNLARFQMFFYFLAGTPNGSHFIAGIQSQLIANVW